MIIIIFISATYKLAEQSLQTRKNHDDTESEVEYTQKRMKFSVANDQNDFNDLFDKVVRELENIKRIRNFFFTNILIILFQDSSREKEKEPITEQASRGLNNNASNVSDATTIYVSGASLTEGLSSKTIDTNESYVEFLNEVIR